MEPVFENSREGLTIGSDKVVFFDHSIVVYAAKAMPDWQVREYCRIPIYFQDRKYYIRRKARAEAPYAMGYELALWPEDLHEESTLAIVYDEGYVAQRNRLVRDERSDHFGRLLLLPIFPLLGFLWSRFKDQQLERFGLNPASMTSASLLVELAVFVLETIFLFFVGQGVVQIALGLHTPGLDYAFTLILLVDMIARFDQVLRGVEPPGGFLEWLANFRRRDRAGSTTSSKDGDLKS